MAGVLIFYILAAVIYKANSQLCGCNGPGQIFQAPIPAHLAPNYNCINPGPCLNAVIPGPQPCIGAPAVVSPAVVTSSPCPTPVVATTIIDNSLSNSLANALQLLIVSNLIGHTFNAGILPTAVSPVCEAIINPCNPVEYHVSPNIVGPCICETPKMETTVVTNVRGCGDIGPIPGYTFSEPLAPMQQTFAPICAGYQPAMYSTVEGVPTMAPVAAEVLFPSSIPAQLMCNFGYMNTNVPCVSVNVEPLPPFDTCCSPNLYTNGYFY